MNKTTTCLTIILLVLAMFIPLIKLTGAAAYDYTLSSSGGIYYGIENIGLMRSTSSANSKTTFDTVMGWISTGATVEVIGTWVFSSQLANIATNCSLDFSAATITGSVSGGIVADVTASISIIGGYWTGTTSQTRFRFFTTVGNCTIEQAEMVEWKWEFTQYCGTNMVVRNCTWHDVTLLSYCIASNNLGYNTYQDILFNNTANNIGGIYVAAWCHFCTFDNLTFAYMGYHSLYLSSYETPGTALGGHEVVGCTFKYFKNNNMAGIHLKCNATEVHGNIFMNFTDSWNNPAISMYSDFDYSNCDDNLIYNNTFMDMYEAIRIGSALANKPQSRNRIFNNTFIDISSSTGVFAFAYGSVPQATQHINDTWIYYNNLYNCPSPFPIYSYDKDAVVHNTIIAYNNFYTAVPPTQETLLHDWDNTSIYGNYGLADYHVPETPDIPPPGESTYYTLTVMATSGGSVNPTVGNHEVIEDTNQTLAASALSGYSFAAWEIDGANETTTSSTWYVVMDGDHTAKAYFAYSGGSPTPTPTATPPTVTIGTYNYYFRSDSYTVNTVTAYGLDSDFTNTAVSISTDAASDSNITYGFRVYKLSELGVLTELTSGYPMGTITLASNSTGAYQTGSWSCYGKTWSFGKDAFKVVVYAKFGAGAYSAVASYITPQIFADTLEASTWTFKLWLTYSNNGSYTESNFYFGSGTYHSMIIGVNFAEPDVFSMMLLYLRLGDYISFFMVPLTAVFGSWWYFLIILAVSGAFYIRYRNITVILTLFILFGGAGGLAGVLLPPLVDAAVWVMLALGLTGLLWRVFR